ncbi:MAG: RnfABCDGE type electron transport complex subunit B [Lachnospiraceae bacterium]|nr:RnfABCDGE type electron transport complex subunit B [Lachnospiraceae bacterium]
MNIDGIIIAVATVGGIGLLIGIFLSVFSNVFRVETDEREEKVLEALPGNNCGGCGYPGCSGLAAAIAKNEAPVNGCPVGGKKVADEIASIMGVSAGDSEKMVAFVKCIGTCDKTKNDYEYYGVKDCRMANLSPGKGAKSCSFGCLGYGTCVSACKFDAIHIINGIAVVDREKCTACGRCVSVCPKGVIELIPYDAKYAVACSSKDKGPDVMKKCENGCIGCSLCQKNCPKEAVSVEGFLAHIDQDLCVGCSLCAQKCPKKVITKLS